MDRIRFLQYIGARYVPKFYVNSQNPDSSEWEPNIDYEYMTWVSLPNGAMFLSKEDVPASVGSPINNPRYWMTAGQFNAYIQQLQTEINDMQDGTVTGSLQNQIDTMQDGTVTGSLQNQISDNTSSITAINGRLTAIEPFGYKLSNRKFFFIGDSYGEQSSFLYNVWTTLVKTYLGLDATTGYVYAISGAGFATAAPNFYGELTTQAAAMTANERAAITDIVVLGGTNDQNSNDAAITTAIATFMNEAKTQFPNAYVHIVYCAYSRTAQNALNLRVPYLAYSKAGRYGAAFVDGKDWLCASQFVNSDGVHPNSDGSVRIATALANYLLGKETEAPFVRVDTTTITALTGYTIYTRSNMVIETYESGVYELQMPFFITVNKSDSSTITLYNDNVLEFAILTTGADGEVLPCDGSLVLPCIIKAMPSGVSTWNDPNVITYGGQLIITPGRRLRLLCETTSIAAIGIMISGIGVGVTEHFNLK